MSLQPGGMLLQYRLLEKIGEGGMGVVYKAFDTRLEREVALKALRPEMAADPERLARFEREARAVAALNHPNIASIHQIDEAAGIRFIAMELIEGQTLRKRIGGRPLSTESMLELAIQIADALEAAHEKGIVHRDIKPANILVTARDQVKVLDFGLAKLAPETADADAAGHSGMETVLTQNQHLTTPGATMGTIAYMSPEQVRGEELDARSDLFSFGAVLYEMATGRNAFAGSTSGLTFDAILNRAPAPPGDANPDLSVRLEEIILKALEKDRVYRYQRAAEMRADLARVRRDTDSGRALAGAGSGPAAVRGRRPESEERPAVRTAGRARSMATYAAALLVLAGLAAVGWFLRGRLLPAGAPAIDALAVLPFENAGNSPDTDYLSDGITESLINSLSRLPDLRVVPRSLVFPYKGKPPDVRQIGKELSVRGVVTGRIAVRGDDLIVSAELIDVATVGQIWGQQYRRRLTDLLSVQEELAREITRNLRLQLTPAEERSVARRYTENTEAYQLYIKSLHEMRKGRPRGYEKAIEYAQQAIVQDLRQRGSVGGDEGTGPVQEEPGFALAYATLARIYTLQAFAGFVPPKEVYPKARAAAQFALEMDDALGDAHGALAFVRFFYEWDWAAAGEQFRRAMELSPSDDEIHKDYSWYLMAIGRKEEAVAEMERATDLDPLSASLRVQLAEQRLWAGRIEEARQATQEALRLDPESDGARLMSAYIHASRGRYQDAIASYMDYLFLAEKESLLSPTLAWFYAKAGRAGDARDLMARATPGEITPAQAAWIHAALGDRDSAFASLEKAYEQRAINLIWIKAQPWFDPLRGDPRFRDLLVRMGLAP